MTLDEINQLALPAYVEHLGGVFEYSPWVAQRTYNDRPFSTMDSLHRALMAAVGNASREEQLALVRAHPDLAASRTMTTDSTSEQRRLGFTALPQEEFRRIGELNRAYREKFGFPCIVALRLHATRDTVLREMERRLANTAAVELGNALGEIGHITRGRLAKLFGEK